MFFNAQRQKASKPRTRPIDEQDERESIRIWRKTAQAVKERNHELATDEKTKIEDMQRDEAAKRASEGVQWHPRLFREVNPSSNSQDEDLEDLEWIINKQMQAFPLQFEMESIADQTSDAETPEEADRQILTIYPVLKGQRVTDAQFVSPQESAGHPPTAGKPAAEDNEKDVEHAVQVRKVSTTQESTRGGSQDTTPTETTNPANNDVEAMLKSTGQEPGKGPLMDFSKDLKEKLPAETDEAKSTKTAASSTENFFDAES